MEPGKSGCLDLIVRIKPEVNKARSDDYWHAFPLKRLKLIKNT